MEMEVEVQGFLVVATASVFLVVVVAAAVVASAAEVCGWAEGGVVVVF